MKTMAADESVTTFQLVQRLKEQILARDRVIREEAGRLRATRDYLERLFEALADAVLVVGQDGRVEFVNQAACELLACGRGELIGTPASALCADPAQGAELAPARLRLALERETTRRSELLLRRRDGNSVPVSWSATVLRGEGRPPALVAVARDLRNEGRVEDARRHAVETLAAGVAHELRNPLGAIQNSVLLLRRDLDLAAEDAALLDIVCRETERMAGIVERFLRFARPAAPRFAPVDLGALLDDLVTLARQDDRAQAGRELLLHVDPGLPSLTGDAEQLRQVVWNLLSNALDAAERSVAVRARAAPGGIEVRVADDGAGMDPATLRNAVRPFHTTKAKGTGLGLAICERILAAHGASLRLESAPGDGTAVSFVLPAEN